MLTSGLTCIPSWNLWSQQVGYTMYISLERGSFTPRLARDSYSAPLSLDPFILLCSHYHM